MAVMEKTARSTKHPWGCMIRGLDILKIIHRQNRVLDPKFIRENPEIVKHATLVKRLASPVSAGSFRFADHVDNCRTPSGNGPATTGRARLRAED